MAQRGRKPKPTALKELEGNPGRRPLNGAEPKPDRKAPRCPSWLEEEAKKEWRVWAILEQMGLLTEMDMAAFASTARHTPEMEVEAEEFITQHGAMVRTQRLSSAGSAGLHRPNQSENHAPLLRAVSVLRLGAKPYHWDGAVDADEMERLFGGEE